MESWDQPDRTVCVPSPDVGHCDGPDRRGCVGAFVSSEIESQDIAQITARSQIEFVLSLPPASSYPPYPTAPDEMIIDTVVVDSGDSLQQLTIIITQTGDEEAQQLAVLEAFKAKRFIAPGVIPKSSGLERIKKITVPTLDAEEGFAVVISQVYPSASPTNILVRWELSDSTKDELRTIAVFEGLPFGSQTEDLIINPLNVSATLAGVGRLRDHSFLSVGARGIISGTFTVYFYNESDDESITTLSAEIDCVCSISP